MAKMIEIYGRDGCRFCAAAQAFLRNRAIPFVYHDFTHDPELKRQFVERFGEAKLVPQIAVGADKIGGYDDLRKAHDSGRLQALIGGF